MGVKVALDLHLNSLCNLKNNLDHGNGGPMEEGQRKPLQEGTGQPTLRYDRPLRFATLNCSGLAGKTHLIEKLFTSIELDFIYLSETWCAPGGTKRLLKNSLFAQEYPRTTHHGRYHYGQTIVFNPKRLKESDFEIVDQNPTNHLLVIRVLGVRFVCCYWKPSIPDDHIVHLLATIENFTVCDEPCVMMGDLNARHVSFGDHAGNRYGTVLFESLNQLSLTRLNPSRGHWTFRNRSHQSIVDHILGNDPAISLGLTHYVDEDTFVGCSEHAILVGTIIGLSPTTTLNMPNIKPWNRWRLNDREVRKDYIAMLENTFDALLAQIESLDDSQDPQQLADDMHFSILNWFNASLSANIGRSPGTGRRPADFLTPELLRREEYLLATRKSLLTSEKNGLDCQELWVQFDEAKKQLETEITARRSELFEGFCEHLQGLPIPEQLRLFHSIKTSKSRTQGSLLKTDQTSLKNYKDHFASQCQNDHPRPQGPKVRNDREPETMPDPFNFDRLLHEMKEMPTGKAAGNSGLLGEAVRYAADVACLPVLLLFQHCWNHSVVPTAWCSARIQPVPKKGDLRSIKNYRPISLTEVLRRLFEVCLLPSVTNSVEPLHLEQGGFRLQRGTPDQACVLQEWVCQAKSRKMDRYMCFLDIKAAYDQVDRVLLWEKCEKKGMPSKLLMILKALFDSNSSCVSISGSCSEEFPLLSGLLQGSSLSPTLYSLFIDDLIEDLNNVGADSLSLGGYSFRCLLYADDIVLLSTSYHRMKELLKVCEEHSIKNRYRFGTSKCEVVKHEAKPSLARFDLYGEALKISRSFVYLGITFTADGIDWNQHIDRMGAKAIQAAWFFNGIGCNASGFDLSTSLRIFNTFVRPIAEYGMALCPVRYVKRFDRVLAKAMKIMASCHQSSSHLTIGMFQEIHPGEIRLKTLQYKYLLKAKNKTGEFAIKYAIKAFEDNTTRNSSLMSLKTNEFFLKHEREVNRARLLNVDPLVPKLQDMKEPILQRLLSEKSTSYIFRRTQDERKLFRKAFGGMPKRYQRLILNWCLGKSVGHWKTCMKCKIAAATKGHVEFCATAGRLEKRDDASPSATEELLRRADSKRDLEKICQLIETMIGSRPGVRLEDPP